MAYETFGQENSGIDVDPFGQHGNVTDLGAYRDIRAAMRSLNSVTLPEEAEGVFDLEFPDELEGRWVGERTDMSVAEAQPSSVFTDTTTAEIMGSVVEFFGTHKKAVLGVGAAAVFVATGFFAVGRGTDRNQEDSPPAVVSGITAEANGTEQ